MKEAGSAVSIGKHSCVQLLTFKEESKLDEGALVERYGSRVLYYCCKRLRDFSAAEEIAQETMLIVVKAVRENRIHSPGGIGTYIFRVAENLVKKRFREKERLSQDIPPDSLEAEWLDSPEAGLLLREDRSQMRRALADLEEADRGLLVRCYTDDEPLEKIAEAMGISYPALRKRKSRALEKLRRIYFDVTKGKKRTLSKREQDGRGVPVDFSKETLK